MKLTSLPACLLAAASLCLSQQLHSQDILWEKSYGGKHADYLFDAVATPDYGFILAGSSLSRKTGNKTADPQGDLDYWVWKMDEHGELDWQKGFGGAGADLLQAVRLTGDGGFLLAGVSDSGAGLQKKDPSRGKEDFWIIKLDARGNEQWQRTIGGAGQEQLSAVSTAPDGGYILAGSSGSAKSPEVKGARDPFGKWEDGFGNLDLWIVKLDGKGDIEWQRTIGGKYADQARGVVPTPDGGYLIAAYSNSPESGNKTEKCYGNGDYWLVKLNAKGNTQWQKSYGGEGDDQPQALIATGDGNFIVAGNSNSGTTGNKNASNKKGADFWMLKVGPKGEILWQQTYDIGETDLLASVVESNDGSLLVGGYSQPVSQQPGTKGKPQKQEEGVDDYVAIRTDANGEEKWRQHAGSSGEDILRKALETRDGGYLLAGTSKGAVSKDRHTGKGGNDFWVVKLLDRDKEKEKKKHIEAFPNPTGQFTNVIVGYDFYGGTGYVYDLAGRQLQSFEVKDRTVPVDLGSYPEGIYLIQIRTEVQSDGVKVMKTATKN